MRQQSQHHQFYEAYSNLCWCTGGSMESVRFHHKRQIYRTKVKLGPSHWPHKLFNQHTSQPGWSWRSLRRECYLLSLLRWLWLWNWNNRRLELHPKWRMRVRRSTPIESDLSRWRNCIILSQVHLGWQRIRFKRQITLDYRCRKFGAMKRHYPHWLGSFEKYRRRRSFYFSRYDSQYN